MKQTKYVSKMLLFTVSVESLVLWLLHAGARISSWPNFLISRFTAFLHQARRQQKLIAPDCL